MILAAYGLPGLSVLEVTFMLNQLGIGYGVVVDSKLEVIKGKTHPSIKVVVFESISSVLKTAPKLRSTKVIALVLDNPYVLAKEYDLPLLGSSLGNTRCDFTAFSVTELREALKEASRRTEEVQIKKTPFNPVPSILKSYNASSLSDIQTQLYRIKDVSQRAEVGRAVKSYFSSKVSLTSLQAKLEKLSTPKVAESFVTLLQTEGMKTLRSVVQAAVANPSKLKSLAKKKKISPFDVKYLIVTKDK